MAVRFQSRLALAMSLLMVATIAVMVLLVMWFVITGVFDHYRESGLQVTLLALENMQYGITLPDRVMGHVGDQMIVTSLMLSELVAIAETKTDLTPADVSAMLRRVRERSKEVHGYPLVDEFWVTDETGKITIGLEDMDFQFEPNSDQMPQASVFYPLLDPQTPPIKQPLTPRDKDEKRVMYVGVGGVDRPRIVQTGVGEQLVESIRKDFAVQNIVDRFYRVLRDQSGLERIAVISCDGTIIADAYDPERADPEILREQITGLCTSFLDDSWPPHEARVFGRHIGLVTRLRQPNSDACVALYMQYARQWLAREIWEIIKGFAILALLMIGGSILVTVKMSRGFSKPLEVLGEGARRLGEGDLSRRVTLETGDEFEELAHSFNAMAGSLQEYMHELELETKRRERYESEIHIAADLQRSLLPDSAPSVPGIELRAWTRPAREVGGDFYDFVTMEDGRIGLVIGDAADKGLPAALLATECWSAFRALASGAHSPAELLQRTNHALCAQTGTSGRFVTLFFGILDVRSGDLTYAIAGHNPPLLVAGDPPQCRWLTADHGLPLGIERDCCFENVTVCLQPGSTLVLYSDGLTEAHNGQNELYGEERVQTIVAGHAGAEPPEILRIIREDVDRHMAGCDLYDDMTLLAMRYEPN